MSATEKQRGGVTGKGFQPGQSGNPGGRKPSLVEAVRKKVGADGSKLVDLLALLAWGTSKQRETFFGEKVSVSAKDRLQAADMLAERGFGKAAQPIELSGEDGAPIRVMFGGRYRKDDAG